MIDIQKATGEIFQTKTKRRWENFPTKTLRKPVGSCSSALQCFQVSGDVQKPVTPLADVSSSRSGHIISFAYGSSLAAEMQNCRPHGKQLNSADDKLMMTSKPETKYILMENYFLTNEDRKRGECRNANMWLLWSWDGPEHAAARISNILS